MPVCIKKPLCTGGIKFCTIKLKCSIFLWLRGLSDSRFWPVGKLLTWHHSKKCVHLSAYSSIADNPRYI